MSELDLYLLKAITSDKRSALDYASSYDEKLFLPEYFNFAKIVISYIKTIKELPTLRVLQERINNPVLKEYVTKTWTEVEKVSYDIKEYKHDVSVIKKRFSKQKLLGLKESFDKLDLTSMDVEKHITEIQSTLNSIRSTGDKKTFISKTAKEYLPDFRDSFLEKRKNPDAFEKNKIKTHFSYFDIASNGGLSRNSDYLLICGETGAGKSQILNQLAVNVWLNGNFIDKEITNVGRNVVFFSLEMPYENYFNRLLSALSGVDSFKIDRANTSKEESAKIKMALDFINKYPYHFHIIDFPRKAKANDLEMILNEVYQSYIPDLVIADYIGIMEPNDKSDNSSDWQNQSEVSREFRDLLRIFNIPGASAVQLNRHNGKDQDTVVGLHRLARSSGIATHATAIVQLGFRGEKEEMFPDLPYYIIKMRNGMKGKGRFIKNFKCSGVIDDKVEVIGSDFQDFDNISNDLEDIEL